MSFAHVQLTLADLPQPIGAAATQAGAAGFVELYPSAVGGSSLHTPESVPASLIAEHASPVLGGDGP
jgi:hypothetical protein